MMNVRSYCRVSVTPTEMIGIHRWSNKKIKRMWVCEERVDRPEEEVKSVIKKLPILFNWNMMLCDKQIIKKYSNNCWDGNFSLLTLKVLIMHYMWTYTNIQTHTVAVIASYAIATDEMQRVAFRLYHFIYDNDKQNNDRQSLLASLMFDRSPATF